MSKITSVYARQVFDSRGNPTVECEVNTQKSCARAMVPSGVSTGQNEAVELRDNGKSFHGKGVLNAVNNVNKIIAKKIVGKDSTDQEVIDNLMISLDGTRNKARLGANAILAVSLAVCRAASEETTHDVFRHVASLFGTKKYVLPVPAFNIINGGKHAGTKLDIQEYMILPDKAKNFSEAMQIGVEVYQELKKIIAEKFGRQFTNVGDEGGFTPPLTCIEEPFDLILDALNNLGYWKKVKLGIDCAASTFYRDGKYYLGGEEFTANELVDKYAELVDNYPLASIEDPFHENDFLSFTELNKKVGKKVQVVGDDLTVTNPSRIQKAIVHNSCNCLLLKVNQIGTLTEAFESAKLAFANDWNVMVSHRSGETEDDVIADLAVGIGANQIKSGAPCRSERLAKYNRLLRIEDCLGKKAKYAGKIL